MRRAMKILIALSLAVSVIAPLTNATAQESLAPAQKAKFTQIGHEPLFNRGMNAGLAVHGDYAYVGFRSDGTHPHPGVAVVDISNPAKMSVVHEITDEEGEGRIGETSRELRVWPEEDLLIVMNLAGNCTPYLHLCSPTSMTMDDNIRFFDISGKNAAQPRLVSEYVPSRSPHEMFLWDDPKRKGRALLYISTPGGSNNMLVTDISGARKGKFKEVANWNVIIPDPDADTRLHSMSISPDGKLGYMSYLGGGFFTTDTSDLANNKKKPKIETITPMQNRAHWGNPGIHSAVPVPDSKYVFTTDEVYGDFFGVLNPVLGEHGCPWGWARVIDNGNLKKPKVIADYRIEQNHQKYCDDPTKNQPDRKNVSSYAAHNPTLTRNLALVTWHSGGLQAVDLSNPKKPSQAAEFKPEPLLYVTTEDPVLSSGRDKVVMWSYPVVKDGVIFVVDLRNGLYALRYDGVHEKEVSSLNFLEGNSNLGDAARIDR